MGANVNVIPTCPTPLQVRFGNTVLSRHRTLRKMFPYLHFSHFLKPFIPSGDHERTFPCRIPFPIWLQLKGVSLCMTRFFVSTSVYLISLQNGKTCFSRFRRVARRMAEVKVSDVIRIDKMFSGVTDEEVST